MQLLELNLNMILYQPLFKERIILSMKDTSESAELSADYPYSFFSSSVRFPNQSKKKNMDLIEESLKEFMEKKIVVKSFERKTSMQFRIYFVSDLTLTIITELQPKIPKFLNSWHCTISDLNYFYITGL